MYFRFNCFKLIIWFTHPITGLIVPSIPIKNTSASSMFGVMVVSYFKNLPVDTEANFTVSFGPQGKVSFGPQGKVVC